MMKYTESNDGEMRTTVHLHVRLTRHEVFLAKQLAIDRGHDEGAWRAVLMSEVGLAVEGALDNIAYDNNLPRK